MTLSEIAAELEKKRPPPEEDGDRLLLNVNPGSTKNGAPYSATSQHQLSRPVQPSLPPGLNERLLGTENLADIIPMEWPQSQPEKQWNEARLTPVKDLGIVLSSDRSRGWLALCSPGMTPLLLYALPIRGRLEQNSLLPDLEPLPCEKSLANGAANTSSHSSRPTCAKHAGSAGAELFPLAPAIAPAT